MSKILFLIRTLNVGGAEHVLVDIANAMAEDGFQVTVQTILDEGPYRDDLHPNIDYRAGVSTRHHFVARVAQRLYTMLPPRISSKLLIGKGFTHLVAFTEALPTKIISGCRQKNVKKMAWVHTDLYTNYRLKHIYGSVEKNQKCYQAFDQVVCVSKDAKEGFLKRFGPHKAIDVQYNPIDKDEIMKKSQWEPAYKIPDNGAFQLAALGRLVPVKGFDMLIEAMAIVKNNTDRPVELYIIGGGSEENALREQIHAHGLENTVYLCGQQMNPYSIMGQCDMQVISSRAEGYPLSLCEGHLLGLPVVSTKCAGPTEIITASGGGILVDHSAQALAEGILTMINRNDTFLNHKKNAQIWGENYDVHQIYRQIESLFIKEEHK